MILYNKDMKGGVAMDNISILDRSPEVRAAFIEKFTLSWKELQSEHKQWIDDLAENNHPVSYNDILLWDKMPKYQSVSFADALSLLKSLSGDVFFMSENETYPYCRGIKVDGKEYKGGVARMNAVALAGLIEYEWYEDWRLSAENMYLENTVLPEDLYVFDLSMEHMIVFTHENDFWGSELEQPMEAAASRVCMMYGFDGISV